MRSKEVDPKFQKALKGAIQNFRGAKSLWKHHFDEIAIMERVVNNNNQTNRELRDGARQACHEINSSWHNWVVKSLLADYVEAVLCDPKFNVEKIYEGKIDELGRIIDLQDEVITDLERKRKPDYEKELEKKLKCKDNILMEVKKQMEESQKELKQSRHINQSLAAKLKEHEKNYQSLYTTHLQTLDKKQAPAKKQFEAPSVPQVGGGYPKGPLKNSAPKKTNSASLSSMMKISVN